MKFMRTTICFPVDKIIQYFNFIMNYQNLKLSEINKLCKLYIHTTRVMQIMYTKT